MDALAVLTTPRRPQYLAATLAGLQAAGGAWCYPRVVFSDGPTTWWPPRWSVVTNTGPALGARAALWWVLRTVHSMGADRLLYCEDDLQVAPGAVDAILTMGCPPDLALVSFFDAHEFPGARRAAPGVHRVPIMGQSGKGLLGACCLLIPRHTMTWALQTDPDGPGVPEHADQALSWALRDGPCQARGVHIPSLVEHVGDVSSMGHKAGQRAALFAGNR